MATRKQVREAFYAELETAANGLVPASNISQEYPNSDEDLPAIVHDDNYRTVPMNTKSSIVGTQTNSVGVTAEVYVELMQAQFSVLVVSDDEQEKEDIYEAVRTHFGDYQYPIKDTSSLQSDVHRVEVNDANSQDTENRDPPARGDRLAVNVGFERFYTKDTTPVEQVQANFDANNDGTTDISNTTT